MRLILKVLGTILVLSLLAGVAKEVNGDDPKKVVPLGGKKLLIPTDTPKNVFAVTKAALEELGYESWYQSCVLGQARSLLTPSEAEEFDLLSKEQRDEISLNLMLKAGPRCEHGGRDIIDPDATSTQLSYVKAQTAETFKQLLAKEGFSWHARTCVASKIKYASDAQMLELANGTLASKEALLVSYIKRCG